MAEGFRNAFASILPTHLPPIGAMYAVRASLVEFAGRTASAAATRRVGADHPLEAEFERALDELDEIERDIMRQQPATLEELLCQAEVVRRRTADDIGTIDTSVALLLANIVRLAEARQARA